MSSVIGFAIAAGLTLALSIHWWRHPEVPTPQVQDSETPRS